MSQLATVFKKAAIPRAIMINLTDLKRKLGRALAVEWDYSVYFPDRDGPIVMSRSMSRGAAASK
jgi:hypothetical protein